MSPLPAGLIALALGLPGIWLAGRFAARWVGGDRAVQAVVAPGIGVSLWLLATHVLARRFGSFSVGLCAATVGVSTAGLIAWIRARMTGAAAGAGGRRLSPWMWAGAIAATAVMTPMALGWAIHDELWILGHMSIPAQMQNDTYPPRHMAFPDAELRYHYGFDLLVAATTAITRLRLDRAIDAVTLLCWGYAFCLLWTAGERVIGRGRGALVAFVTLFGAGVHYACNLKAPLRVAKMVLLCDIEGLWLNPPIASYFFQHPWSLGLPIGVCALLVGAERAPWSARRCAVLGLLLCMLSLSHIVLFLTLSGALLVHEAFSGSAPHGPGLRLSGARALRMLVTLGLTAAVATWLGGFLLRSPHVKGVGIVLAPGPTKTFQGSVVWLLLTFGLLLPLGAAGLVFLRRYRLLLGTLAAGSIASLCLFRYAHSWDIVKFATVASLALSAPAAAAIARLFSARPAILGRGAAILALAGATAGGLAYPIAFGLTMEGLSALWPKAPPFLSGPDAVAVSWLRRRVRPGEIVYRRDPVHTGYALWGGLPPLWLSGEETAFGFNPRRIAARRRLLAALPEEVDAYLQQGVRWLVLEPNDRRMAEHAAAWIEEGRARRVVRVGPLQIVELLRDQASSREAPHDPMLSSPR